MNMKSRPPKSILQKYAIAVAGVWGVFLVIAVLLYALVLGPQLSQIDTLHKNMQTAVEDYTLAQRAHNPGIQQQIQERLEKTVQTLNEFTINTEAASRLTVLISQLAAQHKLNEFAVKTREMTPTLGGQEKTEITEAWLELTFSAPFNHCAAYINALERNEPVIFIESADILKPAQVQEEPQARILVSYLIDKRQPALPVNFPKNPPAESASIQ